jgi:hypothetical protein
MCFHLETAWAIGATSGPRTTGPQRTTPVISGSASAQLTGHISQAPHVAATRLGSLTRKRSQVHAVDRRAGPVDLAIVAEPVQQPMVQLLPHAGLVPHAGLLPSAQPPPAGGPAVAAEGLGGQQPPGGGVEEPGGE